MRQKEPLRLNLARKRSRSVMHELGIVFHIIDSLETLATENKLKEIASVTLEVGEVSGVIDSYLKNCWK